MRTKFNPMVDLNIKNIEKYINWKDLIINEKLYFKIKENILSSEQQDNIREYI